MPNSIEDIYSRTVSTLADSSLNVYTVLLDDNGIIQRANDYAEKISGDLVGKAFRDVVVDFHDDFDLDGFTSSGQEKKTISVSSVMGLPETFYFSWIRDNSYTLLAGEPSREDIDLMRKNLTRTNAELSNLTRRYQKTNVQLTKLNEQKNRFLGIAAHDLRNPLAAILGLCDFLLEEKEGKDEEEISFIQNIKDSSQYMLDLLEDLLDISRIEAGKLQLDLQDIQLIDLVRKNLEINKSLAERKQIKLRFCCHESLPPIQLDPRKIEQVLNNIMSNAIKYSHPETEIEVGLFRSGDTATVSIKDQGIGIPEKDLGKIFQPFAKLKSEGTAGESSTGLGLAIVHRIITGHKGRIWVESEPGEGTTFYFSLPLSQG